MSVVIDGGGVDTSTLLQKTNNLSDILDAPTARDNLGLGTAAVANTGDFDAAGSAAAAQAGAIADAKAGILAGIRAAVAGRRYDAIVRVSTTITAALAAITDNSADKRYMLYVPNGTYNETITAKAYVDIVGESQEGVIVASSSGVTDTVTLSGFNMMLANMTVRHTFNTGDAGVASYPIHIDGAVDGATPSSSSTTILYKVTAESLGTGAKSGIGIGLNAKQRAYLVDCTASSTQLPGIFAHNAASQSSAIELYLINTSATGATYGLLWTNQGSGQTDRISVFGGTFSGGTADIATLNNGGAGEAYIFIDDDVAAPTISLVDATKRLAAPVGASVPMSVSPNFNEYWGTIASGPTGVRIGSDGVIKSLRADKVVFLADADNATVLRLTKTQILAAGLLTIYMNTTALDHISSPLADYLRFTCGNAIVQQLNKTLGTSFYLPASPSAAGATDLGRTAVGWKRLYIDYTNTATIGNVTIDKAAGRVNVAAGASSVTVTNSLCTAASKVFCTVAQNDATAYIKNVVPAAGSFVINLGAAATANCAVDFFIVNV